MGKEQYTRETYEELAPGHTVDRAVFSLFLPENRPEGEHITTLFTHHDIDAHQDDIVDLFIDSGFNDPQKALYYSHRAIDQGGFLLLILEDSTAAGMLTLVPLTNSMLEEKVMPHYPRLNPQSCLALFSLKVKTEFRRQHIASRLEEFVKKTQGLPIFCEISDSNTASEAVHTDFGFSKTEITSTTMHGDTSYIWEYFPGDSNDHCTQMARWNSETKEFNPKSFIN